MLITHINSHEESLYQDEFPLSELQKGTRCIIVLRVGGEWDILIEDARSDRLVAQGGAKFEVGDVTELKLFW